MSDDDNLAGDLSGMLDDDHPLTDILPILAMISENMPEPDSGDNGVMDGPKISARVYDMDVTVRGGPDDALADVRSEFVEQWRRVMGDYENMSDMDSSSLTSVQ